VTECLPHPFVEKSIKVENICQSFNAFPQAIRSRVLCHEERSSNSLLVIYIREDSIEDPVNIGSGLGRPPSVGLNSAKQAPGNRPKAVRPGILCPHPLPLTPPPLPSPHSDTDQEGRLPNSCALPKTPGKINNLLFPIRANRQSHQHRPADRSNFSLARKNHPIKDQHPILIPWRGELIRRVIRSFLLGLGLYGVRPCVSSIKSVL
jgi:hypothetical protein